MATSDVPGRIGIMLRRDADFDRIVVAFRWGARHTGENPCCEIMKRRVG